MKPVRVIVFIFSKLLLNCPVQSLRCQLLWFIATQMSVTVISTTAVQFLLSCLTTLCPGKETKMFVVISSVTIGRF